eukprot:GHVT01094524.1.p2 GENE.GHVT01094524.1~~GHVT01094524.1.p2  ORF type:complete len:106 (+),score=8.33 GHVT01094524.1:1059-1376(+)
MAPAGHGNLRKARPSLHEAQASNFVSSIPPSRPGKSARPALERASTPSFGIVPARAYMELILRDPIYRLDKSKPYTHTFLPRLLFVRHIVSSIVCPCLTRSSTEL